MRASLSHSTASAIAIAALVLVAGCSAGTESSTSPSPSPSPTNAAPSDSATPSPTPTAAAQESQFDRRNPSMTDAEALARIANPTTGESWFKAPRPIAAPAWAGGDPYLAAPSTLWYEFGVRAGNTIVGYLDQNIQELFERSPAGEWQWIGAPSARQAITGATGVTFGFPDVPLNETIYYDSLTLPAAFTLPTGEPLEVHEFDRGGLAIPGYTVENQPSGTTVDSLGGYTIIRYTTPVSFVWSEYYEVDEPWGDVTYKDMFYMLRTPYGTYIPLFYAPFPGLDAVSWSVPNWLASEAPSYLADLNDISCGVWEKDHNTIVSGIPADQWMIGGTTDLGEIVYVPTVTNTLIGPLYDSYVAAKEASGQPAAILSTFTTAPSFVGYVMPGTGEWLVYLNGTYSARAWC